MNIMRLIRRLLWAAVIVTAALGATVYAARHSRPPGSPPAPEDYGAAPVFIIDGLKSDDLRGHKTVLNFFASWCGPCRLEHPVLMQLSKSAPVWGIDTMDKAEDVSRFLAEHGDPYARLGHDDGGTAGIAWGVDGIPATFIIGENGHIIYRHFGPLNDGVVARDILPLLSNKPSP